MGIYCEINVQDCVPGACHNNGTCIDKVGGYDCLCPPGFVGSRCEGDINECLSSPCSSQGTLNCIQMVNGYSCNCKPGYMSQHCEIKVDFCASSPCQNGGFCSARGDSHHCSCPEGFYGKNCEFSGHDCDRNPCGVGRCDVSIGGGYSCICPFGTSGENCELDTFDECSPNPCERGARCENKLGDFACLCPPTWNGKTCTKYDPTFRGWTGFQSMYELDLEFQRKECSKQGCAAKKSNRKCDQECNTYACDFDGGDCTLGVNPWSNCTATTVNCWEVFGDGVCNEECNNQHCLFDGRDCEKKLKACHETYDDYCQMHYADGICNSICNTAECNWDGLDCDEPSRAPKLAEGMISIVVLMSKDDFRRQSKTFLRNIGHQLRTTLRIKKDSFGNDMIYPWNVRGDMNDLNPAYTSNAIQVYMEIDNSRCGFECFETAKDAASFIGATARLQSNSQFPIYQVRGVDTPYSPIDDSPANGKYVALGAVMVLMACFLLGIMITAKRKRERGHIWTPEGFFTAATNRRRRPDGQEMHNLNKNTMACADDASMKGQMSQHLQHWSDDEQSVPKRSRMYDYDHTTTTDYEEPNARSWTQLHFEAAAIRLPTSVMTPPSHHEKQDINARGPSGLTPLMLAASSGQGVELGDELADDESTLQTINDLLAQGADFHATKEITGETPLHFAARHARADAARRLLEAGADANFPCNTGRTPLHDAIAADALGVFQILLRNRATNLNARMNDGTTPLILAARLAIEGMVEALITAEADINAADNSGKTALHWAAAVNNAEGVNILLMHHANRDAQDDKDETPLFLAAREGSMEACKALLDNFANREITDHMDRSPRDVAAARQHNDIVRLLTEHVTRSPQMMTQIMPPIVNSPPCQSQIINQPTVIPAAGGKQPKQPKAKKQAKSNAINNPTSPEDDSTMRRKTTKKSAAQAKKSAAGAQNMLPDIQLSSDGAFSTQDSPVASLPSPYDAASLYPNAMTSHHGMDVMQQKQPPSYDDCIKVNISRRQTARRCVRLHGVH